MNTPALETERLILRIFTAEDMEEHHDFDYALRKEFWHLGIVTEAGMAVVEQVKKDGPPYITATHDSNNPRSGKVMRKIGMKYRYSYEKQWQPKDFPVIFKMYQLNFDGNDDFVYKKYWNMYGNQYVLVELLDRSESVSEQVWQEQIHGLLRLLYPKYIAGVREVVIKGVDRHDKRPDFLLVDANGYIDILEIKKPSAQLLTKQSSYRNNYVPVRDLAGAIQQIEKYIYCLNAWGKDGEQNLQKQLASKLPAAVTPKVVNPQGILLLGRSKDFNPRQKTDFELIKRQYKHIAEIMTYDDLPQRVGNIIEALSQEISAKQ